MDHNVVMWSYPMAICNFDRNIIHVIARCKYWQELHTVTKMNIRLTQFLWFHQSIEYVIIYHCNVCKSKCSIYISSDRDDGHLVGIMCRLLSIALLVLLVTWEYSVSSVYNTDHSLVMRDHKARFLSVCDLCFSVILVLLYLITSA